MTFRITRAIHHEDYESTEFAQEVSEFIGGNGLRLGRLSPKGVDLLDERVAAPLQQQYIHLTTGRMIGSTLGVREREESSFHELLLLQRGIHMGEDLNLFEIDSETTDLGIEVFDTPQLDAELVKLSKEVTRMAKATETIKLSPSRYIIRLATFMASIDQVREQIDFSNFKTPRETLLTVVAPYDAPSPW